MIFNEDKYDDYKEIDENITESFENGKEAR